MFEKKSIKNIKISSTKVENKRIKYFFQKKTRQNFQSMHKNNKKSPSKKISHVSVKEKH
jgi:hypothetical protein